MADPSAPGVDQETQRGLFDGYVLEPGAYDELFDAHGQPREALRQVLALLDAQGGARYQQLQQLADAAFAQSGITFTVYSDSRGVEKTFPFDLIPRIIEAKQWAALERGLDQRLNALEAFLADVYGEREFVRAGHMPESFVQRATGFVEAMRGFKPKGGVYIHIAGIDLVRGPDGRFVVLEDNLRTPSGVSYVLENRDMVKRLLPSCFSLASVRPVDEYPIRLRRALASLCAEKEDPLVVVLTPGSYNSAYFEHSFLARRMGVPLVEGRDLFVGGDDIVYLKTTRGPRQVDVIYRRIDDLFLDPERFREDSLLGVPGLMRAYLGGHVALANAVGNGVADSKAAYCFVPDMIRFYLGQEPLLDQVPTYRCVMPDELAYVLDHLDELVVKEVDGAGGYGMLMGPKATKAEREEFRAKLKAHPEGFVAQPLLELSTCPTWAGEKTAPRRVDLRPYIITGANGRWCLPGGLTRVALVEGSYVVNSSQGGGSKDTWILEQRAMTGGAP